MKAVSNPESKIKREYLEKHSSSRGLYKRAMRLFARGITHDSHFFSPMPTYCVEAEGSRKWDVDGNEYIDYWTGHGALILGHKNGVRSRAPTKGTKDLTCLNGTPKLPGAKSIIADPRPRRSRFMPCCRSYGYVRRHVYKTFWLMISG